MAFYRDLFKEHGVQPDTIRTIEDLKQLPIIDREQLQTLPVRDLISDGYRSTDDLITLSTSGSSGRPFRVFIDADYDAFRKAQSLRPYVTNGRRPTDRSVCFTGHTRKRQKWFEHLGLFRETRIDPAADHALQVQCFEDTRPQIVQGYPSALTSFAAYVADESISVTKPRQIFTDSELLTPDNRRFLQEAFGASIIDVFGTWETGNIAYECGKQRGHHIAIDCVVLELVAQDGTVVEDGEEGEIVCTVLDNLAMPLIRYNLHDIAKRATHACACGRQFPLLEVIAGRSDDLVRLADGRTLSSQGFLTSFSFLAGGVKEFQITQQAVDVFHIAVVPGVRFDDAHVERIRSMVDSTCAGAWVTIDLVDRIEREASGKLRAFRSVLSK